MKKLYRVEVVTSLYVLAEDERDARDLGSSHAREEDAASVSACLVNDLREIDPEWRRSLPYGGDGEKTCVEILTQLPHGELAPKPEDPNQKKLF